MKECPKCHVQHEKEGKYCSRKCANSRAWTDEERQRRSTVCKNSLRVLNANRIRATPEKRIKKECPICHKIFGVFPCQHRIYCSKGCYLKDGKHEFRGQGKGGLRKGSGRGKKGWYKGYYCDSTWELAWVIYNLDHGIQFIRNTVGFDYQFQGVTHKFYPDFIVDGSYVEIKAFLDDKGRTKLEQFSGQLLLLTKTGIQPYKRYVEEKYGKDYIKMYEGNPHNQRHNDCLVCGQPAVNEYCSRRCAGKDRARINHGTKTLDTTQFTQQELF